MKQWNLDITNTHMNEGGRGRGRERRQQRFFLSPPPSFCFFGLVQFSRRTRAETLATQATNTPVYLTTEILLPSDFSIPSVTIHYIHHLYISHNTPCFHPKIFHNLCL